MSLCIQSCICSCEIFEYSNVCIKVNIHFSGEVGFFEGMGDEIDLSGDGGVLKQIVRRAKPDAIAPSDDFPVVDGMYVESFLDSSSQFLCPLMLA